MAEDYNKLVQQIIDEAAGGAEAAQAEALGADDARRFFCDHWNEIKAVIQLLCDRIGGLAKIICPVLIGVGDRLHDTLCPR
ncbi:MAG TPA: hypothetical protein VLB76_09985 [Thermoanaerobaculia bacterium]|nr:hypothetical protein [Thermoanaerobaculia bacterium]